MKNSHTPFAQNSSRAWILAARPKTLTGAIIPVMTGSALAFADGQFQAVPALLCAFFACGMQIAANFINDWFDYIKGADRKDRLGPERTCAQGWITSATMKRGIAVAVLFSCLTGCGLLFYGGWELIVLGALCVMAAFLYTLVLSYQGWGDVLVILFFGFVPVGGTYYVQAHTVTLEVWIASLSCGLIIDTLLVVNNYRDREQDALSGKRTLIVRFGEAFGRQLYLWAGILPVMLCLWFITQDRWYAGLLPLVYLYPHYQTWLRMSKIRSGKKLNSILGDTSRNMLLFGLLLALGLLLKH